MFQELNFPVIIKQSHRNRNCILTPDPARLELNVTTQDTYAALKYNGKESRNPEIVSFHTQTVEKVIS